MPLGIVNRRQPILHMSKIMVHFYSTDKGINQFSICYMINPSLNCNKVCRQQVEKYLSVSFHKNTMETIRYFLRKKNRGLMALIMSYDNNEEKTKKSV